MTTTYVYEIVSCKMLDGVEPDYSEGEEVEFHFRLPMQLGQPTWARYVDKKTKAYRGHYLLRFVGERHTP